MSETEIIDFNEETKLTESIIEQPKSEHKDILVKLKIPALVEIKIAKSIEDKSIIKFKQELDEAVIYSIEVLNSIEYEDFSRDPDFLELQIKEAEEKLDELSKDLWVKLELTDYEDPEDYYSMIKTAKAVFSSSLEDLIEKEKAIKSKGPSYEQKELYFNKVNIEAKLLEIKDN